MSSEQKNGVRLTPEEIREKVAEKALELANTPGKDSGTREKSMVATENAYKYISNGNLVNQRDPEMATNLKKRLIRMHNMRLIDENSPLSKLNKEIREQENKGVLPFKPSPQKPLIKA